MYHLGLRGSEHGGGSGGGGGGGRWRWGKGVSDTGRLSIRGIMLAIPGAELHLNHELMVPCHEKGGWVARQPRGAVTMRWRLISSEQRGDEIRWSAATRTKRGQTPWCTASEQHAISFVTSVFLGVWESVWWENSDAVKHYWVKWVQIIKYLLSGIILKLFFQVMKLNLCQIKMIFIKKFSVILGNPCCVQPHHFFSFSFWRRDTCLYYTICYCGVMKN